jgi:hypothetical protein
MIPKFTFVVRCRGFTSGNPSLSFWIDMASLTAGDSVGAGERFPRLVATWNDLARRLPRSSAGHSRFLANARPEAVFK